MKLVIVIKLFITFFTALCSGCHHILHFLQDPYESESGWYYDRISELLSDHGLTDDVVLCVSEKVEMYTDEEEKEFFKRASQLTSSEKEASSVYSSCSHFPKFCREILTCSRSQGIDIPQLHYLFWPSPLPPLLISPPAPTSFHQFLPFPGLYVMDILATGCFNCVVNDCHFFDPIWMKYR